MPSDKARQLKEQIDRDHDVREMYNRAHRLATNNDGQSAGGGAAATLVKDNYDPDQASDHQHDHNHHQPRQQQQQQVQQQEGLTSGSGAVYASAVAPPPSSVQRWQGQDNALAAVAAVAVRPRRRRRAGAKRADGGGKLAMAAGEEATTEQQRGRQQQQSSSSLSSPAASAASDPLDSCSSLATDRYGDQDEDSRESSSSSATANLSQRLLASEEDQNNNCNSKQQNIPCDTIDSNPCCPSQVASIGCNSCCKQRAALPLTTTTDPDTGTRKEEPRVSSSESSNAPPPPPATLDSPSNQCNKSGAATAAVTKAASSTTIEPSQAATSQIYRLLKFMLASERVESEGPSTNNNNNNNNKQRVGNFEESCNSPTAEICKRQRQGESLLKSQEEILSRTTAAAPAAAVKADTATAAGDRETEWQDQVQGLSSLVYRGKQALRPTVVAQDEEEHHHHQSARMPNSAGTTSKYKTLSGPSSRRRSSSAISTIAGRAKETFTPMTRSEYTRLGYSYHKPPPETSLLGELKRFLLLVLIVAICSLILWQIYEALVDEDNLLGVARSPSVLGKFNHYAVSTDAAPCARVGKNLLAKGGHAVDAAIGTLLCMGVVLPNSLGLGGGCLMTVYDNVTKKATVIDGRETAPDYATEDMFAANPLSSSRGPLSVGVPGELAAYWEAHQRFGRLNWSQLFDETIDMAESGFTTVEHLSHALRDLNHAQYITEPLAKLMTSNATGEYYLEGEPMYQRTLAATLRRIRDNGAAEFYNGTTGRQFVDDLQKQGGKLTFENLGRYRALVKEALTFEVAKDIIMHTVPVPGSGVVLSIIMRIMDELNYFGTLRSRLEIERANLYYHHLVESFKYAYAQRAGLESDPDDPKRLEELIARITTRAFAREAASGISDKPQPSAHYGGLGYFQEDHGTAHTSVVDGEGNSVAVTTSVNLYFGSGLVSPTTGIIYNDVMDDFTSPNITNKFGLLPSKYNRIRPGKRPLSSMAPSVFVDQAGRPKLVLGASGGSKITTAIASVALRNLFVHEDIKTAIDGPRLHHQYLPDKVNYEANFPRVILASLEDRGHQTKQIMGRSSVVMAIACEYKNNTKFLTANSDYRKGGSVDGA